MRKWESLDREQASKSNAMEHGARVQEGGEEYTSRTGFSAHPVSHMKSCEVRALIGYNKRPRGVYNPVLQKALSSKNHYSPTAAI